MDIRDRIKELRRIRAGDLRPSPRNWRKHPQAQQDALRGVLAEVGYADALIARELPDGGLELVDGHLRAETTPDTLVPVLVTDLDEHEAAKVLATLDPLAAMAEADPAALDALLREVQTSSEAVASMLEGLAEGAGILGGKGEVTEDKTPELPADPVTKPGDLWLLGDHRLLCGDSTDESQWRPLVGDAVPTIQIVDPPFDADYSAWPLLADRVAMVWQRGVRALQWETLALAETWGCYEMIFTGGVRGWPCDWFPCTVHDTVRMWRSVAAVKRFDFTVLAACKCRTVKDGTRPFSVQEHAGGVLTGYGGMSWGKALVAMEIAMANIDAGELCWDPCAGSGTSLIAAEKHGRRWIGMENQPQWADLIVTRWEEFTGQKAKRKVLTGKGLRRYNAGRAGADTPATPKRRRSAKETADV